MKLLILLLTVALPFEVFSISLEGTWKSSKELTNKYNNENTILDDRKRSSLSQLMGHMTIDYRNGISKLEMPTITIYANDKEYVLEGNSEESFYKVVASDKNTIVIETKDFDDSKTLVVYHFEDDTIWVYVAENSSLFTSENTREYFLRIK